MTDYQEAKKNLRPKDKKKLIGIMKQAQKKKKAGQSMTVKTKLSPKHR